MQYEKRPMTCLECGMQVQRGFFCNRWCTFVYGVKRLFRAHRSTIANTRANAAYSRWLNREKTAIGHAKRDIEAGEVIGIIINPDGSLESDAISFLDGVTFADLVVRRTKDACN